MDSFDNADIALKREAALDGGPWKRNLIIFLRRVFGNKRADGGLRDR
jgi:hypothetical protein